MDTDFRAKNCLIIVIFSRELGITRMFQQMFSKASERLEKLFKQCSSVNSCLIMDPSLEMAVNHLVTPSIIQSSFKGVFSYRSKRTKYPFHRLVFITQATDEALRSFTDLSNRSKVFPKDIMVVVTKKIDFATRDLLSFYGFQDKYEIIELDMPVWILDNKISSFETGNSFINSLFDQCDVELSLIRDTLNGFAEKKYYTNITAVGSTAISLLESLPSDFLSTWSNILILDRNADLVTPFVTPLTFEALVAEYLNFKHSICDETVNGSPVMAIFDERNTLLASFRDKNLQDAIDEINQRRVHLEQHFQEFDRYAKSGLNATKMSDVQSKMSPNIEIYKYFNISSKLFDVSMEFSPVPDVLEAERSFLISTMTKISHLDPAIVLSDNWRPAVKLLALYCQTKGGDDSVNVVRQAIIDRFGVEALAALWTLEETGMVTANRRKILWSKLLTSFNLYVDSQATYEKPYGGYIPLVVRLASLVCKRQFVDLKTKLETAKVPVKITGDTTLPVKKVLVIFTGGSFYGESACLRLLSKELGVPIEIMTTEMLSTNSALDQLLKH